MTKMSFIKYSTIGILLLSIIVIRLPFLSNVLQGEEGFFAQIVAGPSQAYNIKDSSKPFLGARIGGKNFFQAPSHPILPYLFLQKIIRPIVTNIDQEKTSFQEKSIRARLSFLFIFTIGFLFFILISRWIFTTKELEKSALLSSLMFFTLSSPLVVGGSIQPQLDGSIGGLMMGATAFFLTNAYKNLLPSLLCYVLAGFICALGKNEWAIALLFSVLLCLSASFIVRKQISLRYALLISASIITGIILGGWASYSASPANFLGGFHVANDIYNNKTTDLMAVLSYNLHWIWQLGVIALFSTILMIKNIKVVKNPFPIMILYILGLALGGGFLFVPWFGDYFPRYYIPSFFILLCTLSVLIKNIKIKRPYLLIAVFIFGSFININSLYQAKKEDVSVTSSPGISNQKKESMYFESYKKFRTKPIVIDDAYGYYFQNADFINASFGKSGAKTFLLQHTTHN